MIPFHRSKLAVFAALVLASAPASLLAFAVQLGDTRQTVIETYGYPKSQAQLEAKEIFNYAEGSVVLEYGMVSEIRFTKAEPRRLKTATPPKVTTPKVQAPPAPAVRPTQEIPKGVQLPEPRPPSMLKLFAPALILMAGAVIFGVIKIIRASRKLRRDLDFIGQPSLGSSNSQKSASKPAEKIERLSRGSLDRLEWRRFEELTQLYFEKTGWTARRSAVGADGGIDIYLEKADREKRVACVQCKQRSNQIIGVKFIREFYGVMVSEGIPEGFFITTHLFSDDAIAFAKGKSIHLITGDELIRKFQELPDDVHVAAVEVAFRGDFETPTCPSCDVKMVSRQGGGGGFWGCRNFPRCRRTFVR